MSAYSYTLDCGAPGMLANGTVELSSRKQRATFSCDPGYQLEGDTIRVCQVNGLWSGQLPSCTREPKENALYCVRVIRRLCAYVYLCTQLVLTNGG